MNPELIELRPDRLLLNSNFNGYKLSLDPLWTASKELPTPVDRILNPSHYSFLHTKLFGLHNHLIGETLNDYDSVYFVDNNWNVCKMYLDPFTDTLIDPIIVWSIPKRRNRLPDDYHTSIRIINQHNIAVVSDGMGMLYILDTGIRNDDDLFNILYSDEVIETGKSFLITDAVYIEGQNNADELHLLLLSVEHNDEKSAWFTVLNWITLTNIENSKWGQVSLRELRCKGDMQYAYLTRDCKAVYVVSENGCKFTINSDNPVKEEEVSAVKKVYLWSQTIEEINIKFPLPADFDRANLAIKSDTKSIEVKNGEQVLLNGDFSKSISADLTTWTVEDNCLEIVLQKQHSGDMWVELVPTDQNGEYMDGTLNQEVHERLAHLTSDNPAIPTSGTTFNSQQVEECDFEIDKSMVFERLDCSTNKVTHKAHFGTHQVLLMVNLNENNVPALGLRHDVDVCLWQPTQNENKFTLTHEGTLLAFGYVQASKQQKKYCVCAPDLSYSVICESTRHLFIYRQKIPVESGELRNRSTGRQVENVAQQQVVNIPNSEILGIYSNNKYVFLLGESFIMAIKLC